MTVRRARVGDVLALQRRSVTVELTGRYEEIGIRSFGRGIFHKEPVTGAELGTKRVFRIEPGDLVISNVFAWEGAIAVASKAEAGRIGSHRFMTFVPAEGGINTSWASWFFLSERGLELIRKASPGSAGRNRTLAIDRFEALEIPLPPIDEQRRQAKRLNSAAGWTTKAAARFRQNDADSLVALLPALVDVLIERNAASFAPVSELADFIPDTVHPGYDPTPADSFVGLQHIESHTGRCVGTDPIGFMKGRKFRFRPGDVIYGYLRPYLNKVWVADRHGLCSVDQYVLRPHSGISADLLAYGLRGREALNQAIELTHSLQLPRLRSGQLASLEVPVISEGRARLLVSRLDDLRDRVVAAAAKRRLQDELVSALLPSAMNEVFSGLS